MTEESDLPDDFDWGPLDAIWCALDEIEAIAAGLPGYVWLPCQWSYHHA